MTRSLALPTAIFLFSSDVLAECLTDRQLAPLVSAWADDPSVKVSLPSDLTMADAQCSQGRLVTLLGPAFGKVVGWKVAATSSNVQAAIRGGPTRGVLLEKMLIAESPEAVKLIAGLRNFEADLILQVRDAGINDAQTPLEIMQHLSNFVPFIELPNVPASFLAAGTTMTPAILTTINSVGRQGIVGKAIPLKASWDWVIALGTMSVVTIQDGKEISRVPGAASLGNPINAVDWLIKDLKASGKRLEAGDLISTGTFSPPVRPSAGQTYVVRYEGLPTETKNAEVGMKFQ
ncbi:MAG: hypothetical protein U1E61_09330 [Bradyrhizobium sp.]